MNRISSNIQHYILWYVTATAGVLSFLLLPGGIAEKSRTLLHGLCAQTPTHTFSFGGQMLPFDARMTGIYGGVFAAIISLAVRRRLMDRGVPKPIYIAVLAFFVLVMAADGFNSLFTDLGIWHPWTPTNELRLVTGYLAGVSLGVLLAWLLASSVYRMSEPEPGVRSGLDLVLMVAPLAPYAAMILSGEAWLYAPLSLLLVVSAWLTMTVLALSIVVLVFRLDDRVTRAGQLHLPGTAAAILGLGVMLALALGRVWLEQTLGIPSTLEV